MAFMLQVFDASSRLMVQEAPASGVKISKLAFILQIFLMSSSRLTVQETQNWTKYQPFCIAPNFISDSVLQKSSRTPAVM